MGEERVGLVLAGGGARGAYEVGALSVLLPALEADGQRPSVLVGTSVGAINIAYFAANAHLGTADAVAGGIDLWRSLRWEQVLAPLLAPSTALRELSYIGGVLGVPGVQLKALLDTTPLTETVQRVIDFAQLHRNVEAGRVYATAVVATSAATSESVLFVEGGTLPPEDVGAGLDYVATRLSDEHVRASMAIPALFPAVHVSQPARAQGWYLDGGARLNAPVRPARRRASPSLPGPRPSQPDAGRPPRRGQGRGRLALPANPLHLRGPGTAPRDRSARRAGLRRALRGPGRAALGRPGAARAPDRRPRRAWRPAVLPVLRPRVRRRPDRTRPQPRATLACHAHRARRALAARLGRSHPLGHAAKANVRHTIRSSRNRVSRGGRCHNWTGFIAGQITPAWSDPPVDFSEA